LLGKSHAEHLDLGGLVKPVPVSLREGPGSSEGHHRLLPSMIPPPGRGRYDRVEMSHRPDWRVARTLALDTSAFVHHLEAYPVYEKWSAIRI
jgi:hypothetical protein